MVQIMTKAVQKEDATEADKLRILEFFGSDYDKGGTEGGRYRG